MAPRRAEAYQQIKDERREEILRAARKVFTRKGLAAARISDIAAEADISQGLIYHYFDNKEAVYTAIIEAAVAGGLRVIDEALARPGTPWAQLSALAEVMVAGVRENPDYLLTILQALMTEDTTGPARRALTAYGSRIFENLRDLVRRGQESGEVVAGDPTELTLAYLATIQGLSLSRLLVRESNVPLVFPSAAIILRTLKAGGGAEG
jgi:AcrR family transcriptional regulator